MRWATAVSFSIWQLVRLVDLFPCHDHRGRVCKGCIYPCRRRGTKRNGLTRVGDAWAKDDWRLGSLGRLRRWRAITYRGPILRYQSGIGCLHDTYWADWISLRSPSRRGWSPRDYGRRCAFDSRAPAVCRPRRSADSHPSSPRPSYFLRLLVVVFFFFSPTRTTPADGEARNDGESGEWRTDENKVRANTSAGIAISAQVAGG